MCGRFGLSRPERLDLNRFGIDHLPTLSPRFNIPPGDEILVVRLREGERRAEFVKWGLVPWWATDPSIGARLANARADTAWNKPSFRDPMRLRRCLIPADLFYEWQAIPGQRRKQPFAVRLRNQEPFAIGGIWDYWRPKEGGEGIASCSILTTEPNTLLTPIHDRMPVIVPPDRYRQWLDPRTPGAAVKDLMQSYPSDQMDAWPIGARVNSTTEDDEGVLELATVEPPPLRRSRR
jgi:putative SOS response-associated peptidase YedK